VSWTHRDQSHKIEMDPHDHNISATRGSQGQLAPETASDIITSLIATRADPFHRRLLSRAEFCRKDLAFPYGAWNRS